MPEGSLKTLLVRPALGAPFQRGYYQSTGPDEALQHLSRSLLIFVPLRYDLPREGPEQLKTAATGRAPLDHQRPASSQLGTSARIGQTPHADRTQEAEGLQLMFERAARRRGYVEPKSSSAAHGASFFATIYDPCQALRSCTVAANNDEQNAICFLRETT